MSDSYNFDDFLDTMVEIQKEIEEYENSIKCEKEQIEITVDVYTMRDEYVTTLTCTWSQFVIQLPDYKNYYIRVHKYGKIGIIGKCKTKYFGVSTSNNNTLTFDMGSYLNNFINIMIQKDKPTVSLWYDMLVRYSWIMNRLKMVDDNKNDYETILNEFLKRNKTYEQVFDLNNYKNISGIYIMCLDEYKTCYVGQSDNIRNRIMRHWSRCDYYTGNGVDIMKPLDTTRIYVKRVNGMKAICDAEYNAIKKLSKGSVFNILRGDLFYLLDKGNQLMLNNEQEACKHDSVVCSLKIRHAYIMSMYHEFRVLSNHLEEYKN